MKKFYHCGICNKDLPPSKFYLRKSGPQKGKIYSPCKKCGKVQSARFRKRNPELKRKLANTWYHKNKSSARNTRLKSQYGITLENYKDLLVVQNGVCAVCGKPETMTNPKKKTISDLAVDHNHITGKVRGLLCRACNTGIGCFSDDPQLMVLAANYVRRVES